MSQVIESESAAFRSPTAAARSGAPVARPRRVAILTHTWCWGGMENHTVQLAHELAESGHDVTIVAAGPETFERVTRRSGNRVAVQHIPIPRPHLSTTRIGELWRALRQIKADIVVLAKGDFQTASIPFYLLARTLFPRFIVIEHALGRPLERWSSKRYLGGLIPGLGLWWWRRRIRGWVATRMPQRIICVSEAVRRDVLTHGVSPARVAVCRSGVDVAKFRPDPECWRRLRRKWGIPEDAFVFGVIGRLSPEKQIHVAIEGVARLRALGDQRRVSLVICGDGPESGRLKLRTNQLGVTDWVVFLGFVDDVASVTAAIDALVLPSRTEGYGLVVAEALASGKPVVAMRVGGVPEILTDPELGELVPAGDESEFIAAMARISRKTPGELAEMGQKCREYAVQNLAFPPAIRRLIGEVLGEVGGVEERAQTGGVRA